MKKIIYLSLLFIIIPFLVAFFFYQEVTKEKVEKKNLEVRVKRKETDKIEKVNLEKYVIGVVAGEIPATFHLEALKAQAVASRSYVLKRMDYNKEQEYDVIDTVTNQVYIDEGELKKRWGNNYQEKLSKIKNAVLMTKGEYISYDNKIADTLYFSTSNGFTENSEEIFDFFAPYLRSVESIWDKNISPSFYEEREYKLNDFFNLLNIPNKKDLIIKVFKKSSTGRILKIMINGKEFEGKEIVEKLKLRSNHFEFEQNNENLIIKTLGYGHGVGMSQYGALGMALEGYLYDEILRYYYQGTEIEVLK